MELIRLLALSSPVIALQLAPWDLDLQPANGQPQLSLSRLQTSAQPHDLTPLEITSHVIPLTRRNARSKSSGYAQTIREQAMAAKGLVSKLSNGTAPMIQEAGGTIFLVPVTVGGQDFEVILDTGSSDPWLVTPDFQCVDFNTGDLEDQDFCWFGSTYESDASSTFTAIQNENINVAYADGEYLTGSLGYEEFTMGGITVPKQKFGLMDYAGWMGDGVSSGLIGFAYSTITSAYQGTDPTKDKKGHTLTYNTLFTNMWNLSLIAPVFSLVLDRDPNLGGLLALGGIPDIPHSPIWVSTPIESVGVFAGTTTPAYEYYSIHSDGFAVSASQDAQFGPVDTDNPDKTPLMEDGTVIVDSGTSLLYAPNEVADAVAAAFDPPAEFDEDRGMYVVDCDATSPTFGASVNGKIFFVHPADLIVPSGMPDDCIVGVQPNNGGLTILGDVWMKNVISVHDIGAQMMRFAAREFYGLSTDGVEPSS